MFERFIKIVGDDFSKVQKVKVMVIGVGGVGGYVVEALVRSGIEDIVIIDFDRVELSNKNRQIIALDSTIGMDKVDCFEMRIKDINPKCSVVKKKMFLGEDNIDIISLERPDYVIDCCDTVKTKKAIIKKCLEENIKFISSMGTGNKLDPSLLEITDIRKTINDPLARIMRNWVKKEHINNKILVLSSREVPIKPKDGKVGSTSFVPASAGLLIASYVIRDILGKK